ncbi:hypothetical protein DRP43_03205 [candidate division TA06 bacterium]|uniref:N-acetyltransferase domain-containing protein n=1 Tax=candidate division TA06 bacterium TaxID=2250710 RepID=A0A660SIC8_UNCT6|nr:MAG: hypothetical protein DRP43_03205 [candidate division TA06 bacterium]
MSFNFPSTGGRELKGGGGSFLLKKIKGIAKKGYKGIELDVLVDNRSAIRLYKKKGYKIVKRK